jgi:fluoride ion exporter CrcB/FEX
VEIEFALSLAATGGIIMVAGATAGATLRVLLAYETKRSARDAGTSGLLLIQLIGLLLAGRWPSSQDT